jgi:hypothetical protein
MRMAVPFDLAGLTVNLDERKLKLTLCNGVRLRAQRRIVSPAGVCDVENQRREARRRFFMRQMA